MVRWRVLKVGVTLPDRVRKDLDVISSEIMQECWKKGVDVWAAWVDLAVKKEAENLVKEEVEDLLTQKADSFLQELKNRVINKLTE